MKRPLQSCPREIPVRRPRSYRPQVETLEGRFYPGDTVLGWTLLGSRLLAMEPHAVPAQTDARPNPATGAQDASRLAILAQSSLAPGPAGDEPQLRTEVKA